MFLRKHCLSSVALAALALPFTLPAQVVPAPATPQIGSSNTAPPEPNVTRPTSTPCTVTLFSNMAFNDYSAHPISYTPSSCKGPWAKVILTADFTVTAGRQYDRTGTIYLGNVNVFFGTTSEPRATLSPSWHVERDLTDYSALFTQKQTGDAFLGNIYNSTYNGGIYGTATLLFYPADAANPAPATATQVLGLSSNNQTTFVNTFADQQSATFTLPRNVTRAYLDVISQSQSGDEFWYTCVPNNVANQLLNCGNTGFRETEVTIDGTPAGVAPVYPWIYTGGIDPYLWEPIPGVETLNLKPYRVDLSPFAGVLSDGKPHTVAVAVFNANAGFSEASNLLVYTDPNTKVVTGGITNNTLTAAPTPSVETYIGLTPDGSSTGPITVQSSRAWQISGYVLTSAGRTDTTITANNSFKNIQTNDVSSAAVENDVTKFRFQQNVQQEADQQETTTVTSPNGTTKAVHNVSFPLVANFTQAPNDANDGGFTLSTYIHQQKKDELIPAQGFANTQPTVLTEAVESDVTRHYNASGVITSLSPIYSQSTYGSKDNSLKCIFRSQMSQALKLTQFTQNNDCSAVQF